MAWVSFCISTYKRPQFLHQQIESLLEQAFQNFEIVISDNDPEASGEEVVALFNKEKIKYYHNPENLGMIKSFNKSIERAGTDYIVMVTDDDPVDKGFLAYMHDVYTSHPGFSLYGGFARRNKPALSFEIIDKKQFIIEILDWNKTSNLLWSSCVIERASALKVGMIPEYGSPHLADHAFLALVGNEKGGVVVNKMFSTLTSHDNNFSKINLDAYFTGCTGFYSIMTDHIKLNENKEKQQKIILFHIQKWLIDCVFTLRRYYTLINGDKKRLEVIDQFAKKILSLTFMQNLRAKYFFKQVIFNIKMPLMKLIK